MNRHKLFIGFLFWIFPLTLFSQRYVSGRITDANDGEPVHGASVFIAGTTVGNTTDTEGYYRLKIPGPGSYKLTVSHAAYQPFFSDIKQGRKSVVLNAAMQIRELEEVTVAKTVKFRKEDVDLFWKTILGKKPAKNTIFAKNPETVYYYYNPENKILTVTCGDPLQIMNLETGYQIEYVLALFMHDYNTNLSHWDAQVRFTELDPENIKQKYTWGKNREKAYCVSVANFIRSLYNNSLKENGFLLVNTDESYFEPVKDSYGTPINPTITSRVKSGQFGHGLSEPSYPNLENFLSTDSVNHLKMLNIPPDSVIMLVCLGKPLVEKDSFNIQLAQNKQIQWALTGLFRIKLETPDSLVYIFPDGTFKNTLQLSPKFSSNMLTGLNMMLPIEYNLDIDSNAVGQVADTIANNELADEPVAESSPETGSLKNPVEDSLNNVIKSFERQLSEFPQEKVYLQTDKPYYLSGERIWFRAHIVDAATHIPDLSASCVYVELFDMRDSVVCRVKTGFENNSFSGYIPVPEDVPEGDYVIRAYTGTMRNMDEDYFFMKNIRIANPMAAAGTTHKADNAIQNKKNIKAPLPAGDFNVTFYPEGGQALYGCMGRIAFKAMQSDGKEIDVNGIVYNGQGNEITRFKTDLRGMGIFVLTPKQGETCYAECTNAKGLSKRFELPAAKEASYTLSATWNKDRLIVKALHSEPHPIDETLCLVVHTRGIVQDVRILDDISKPVVFEKSFFSSGVSNLLLLSKDMLPLSERLVFAYNDDQANVESVADRNSYSTRSQVEDTVKITNESGDPLSGNFSISVTDDYAVAVDTTSNILASLLLSSDLRGHITDPAFYFRKNTQSEWAAELLMMTQGWRRYDTERIVKNDFIYPDTLLEKEFQITGTVKAKGYFSSKPEANANVNLISLDGKYFDNTLTDSNGRFYFPDEGAPDSTRFIVQTIPQLTDLKTDKIIRTAIGIQTIPQPNDKNLELTLDKASWPHRMIPAFPSVAPEQELLLKYADKAEKQYINEHGIRSVQLKEVTVTAQKKPQRKSSYYSIPDHSITEDEIDRRPPTSIHSLLMRLPGVRIAPNDTAIYVTQFGQNCPIVNFLVDDFPTDNIDWLDVFDIAQIDLLTSPTNLASFGMFGIGSAGSCGAIAIYTKQRESTAPKKKSYIGSIVPLGFQKPAEFYAPKYESPEQNTMPDLRTTIHWQPNLVTDENGMASFSFYTADTPSTYSILIEGITDDGKIIYKRDTIRVDE